MNCSAWCTSMAIQPCVMKCKAVKCRTCQHSTPSKWNDLSVVYVVCTYGENMGNGFRLVFVAFFCHKHRFAAVPQFGCRRFLTTGLLGCTVVPGRKGGNTWSLQICCSVRKDWVFWAYERNRKSLWHWKGLWKTTETPPRDIAFAV